MEHPEKTLRFVETVLIAEEEKLRKYDKCYLPSMRHISWLVSLTSYGSVDSKYYQVLPRTTPEHFTKHLVQVGGRDLTRAGHLTKDQLTANVN